MSQVSNKQLKKAIDVLINGGVIVFPTETSYGLAADATNSRAVERIFAIKERDLSKTLPIIVSGMAMATDLADLPIKLKSLARKAWPGPLTIIAPATEDNNLATGIVHQDGTIALRVSSHPTPQYLAKKLKRPLVATSANLSGQPAVFSISELRIQLANSQLQPDLILDAGSLPESKPSTIAKEVDDQIIVLRAGVFVVPGSKHRAKKSFGQHFLKDKSVVEKIVAAAEIQAGETVLEVGPGQGILTEALIEAGAKVIAVEADEDLIPGLKEKFGNAINLISDDIFSVDLNSIFNSPYKIVSNLPYNISSVFLTHFLKTKPAPSRMVLMLQKEVVDRIVAKPPKMSLLSVVCQIYADCKKIAKVPRGAFQPMPKVESAVIQLDLIGSGVGLRCAAESNSAAFDPEQVISLAKAGFSSKRKQLRGNLAAVGKFSREEVSGALKKIEKDPQVRAEVLTVKDWINLAQELGI